MLHTDPLERPPGTFSGDPQLDAEFEALIRDNELMLIEISERRVKTAQMEKDMKTLEEKNAQLQQEVDSLREFCADKEKEQDRDAEHQDLVERYENLL